MPFSPLAYRMEIPLPDFPREWEPIVHLYDPDLPLFPTQYFHVLPIANGVGRQSDRTYGFIERVVVNDAQQGATAHIISNKDLSRAGAAGLLALVTVEVSERLGILHKVEIADVLGAFLPPYESRNAVLAALWQRVASRSFGGYLPFGRTWDHTLGLARWVASFNTKGGRKAELIMTHYFASKFGERIQSADGLPQVDFYLLPTLAELRGGAAALGAFPLFEELVRAVDQLEQHQLVNGAAITRRAIGRLEVSKFNASADGVAGPFNTERLMHLFDRCVDPELRRSLFEVYNAFNKGPPRTILFLLMLADLKSGRLVPEALTVQEFGELYRGLSGTYQSPKVTAMYSQQAFGNPNALPIDTWIATFFRTPLNIGDGKTLPANVFDSMVGIGKVERLIWMAAQARKVHSSICDDALWCMKYAGPEKKPRGAGPLACAVCLSSIRVACSAFASIRDERVEFNVALPLGTAFTIKTSMSNNAAHGQSFIDCTRPNVVNAPTDDFTPKDCAEQLRDFPQGGHIPDEGMTVAEFVARYRD